jgi:hypothetical protein
MEINIKTEQDMKYKIKKGITNKKYFYFAISLQDSTEQLLCNFNQMVPQWTLSLLFLCFLGRQTWGFLLTPASTFMT